MREQLMLRARFRTELGTAASRRLRRLQELAPGVLYGGGGDPVPLAVAQRDLRKAMQQESFFSQILTLAVGDKTQACVLRDLQRHVATEEVLHVDFLRIREDQPLEVHVPLHFLGEDQCAGVKLGGGRLAHNLIEVEVSCLPKNLPEFIEVDVTDLQVGQAIHLSDLTLPAEVAIVALGLGEDHDIPVVSVAARRGGGQEDEEEDTPAEGDDQQEAQ